MTNFRNWLEKAQEIRSGIPRIRGVKGLPGVLSRGELSVVYQPIVSLTTMEPFAYEALVRSDSPHWTTPPKLFEEAIKSRCVGALGRAIREIATTNCTNMPLFLNVHPNEFDESWLVREVVEPRNKPHGRNPSRGSASHVMMRLPATRSARPAATMFFAT